MQRGHLEERRPGVWRFRLHAGYSPEGKIRERSKTFPAASKTAAAKVATALLKQWDDEAEQAAAVKGTLAELVAEWVAWKERDDSPATAYRRRAITDRIVKDLGKIKLTELSARHLDRWYVDLAKPAKRGKRTVTLSASTIHHHHRVLHAILERGYRWDMVAGNVADKATPPKVRREDQAVHMPTMAAVRAALGKASPTVRTAVLLAVTTGCRRGELVGLRWSDLEGETLVVRRALVKVPGSAMVAKAPKNDREKRVLLNPSMLQHLAEFRAWQRAWQAQAGATPAADGPILAHLRADPTGRTPFPPDWLSQEWERVCKRAKLTGLKFHGLRHLHGSSLIDAGVPLATTAKRQGHASVTTTAEFYTHSLDASDVAAAGVVEAFSAPLFELGA